MTQVALCMSTSKSGSFGTQPHHKRASTVVQEGSLMPTSHWWLTVTISTSVHRTCKSDFYPTGMHIQYCGHSHSNSTKSAPFFFLIELLLGQKYYTNPHDLPGRVPPPWKRITHLKDRILHWTRGQKEIRIKLEKEIQGGSSDTDNFSFHTSDK